MNTNIFTKMLVQQTILFAFALLLTTPIFAQTPVLPANGKIAFTSTRAGNPEIYSINQDGTDTRRLTFNPGADDYPAWSSDGLKIAYLSESSSGQHVIKIMNADGSGQRTVTPIVFDLSTWNFCGERFSLDWSPDDRKIVFQEFGHIVTVNVDGTNRQNITNTSVRESEPSWGSTGLIAYVSTLALGDDLNGLDIRTTDGRIDYAWYGYFTCSTSPDLSSDGKLAYVHSNDFPPPGYIEIHPVDFHSFEERIFSFVGVMNVRWSPDGNYLVFTSSQYPTPNLEIVDQFGQGRRALTQGSNPSWQPLVPAEGPNPIDRADFFVRQQYRDFLGREPDSTGFANWMATLGVCPNGGYGEFDNPHCDRVHVSAGFVQSHEFQGRGYWTLRFGYVGLNRSIGSVRSSATYAEFIPALAQVGGSNSPAQEETAKVNYASAFVQRQDFLALFPITMTASQYVNALESNAQVTLPNKQSLIDALNLGTMSRADVLRNVVESQVVFDKYLIPAFVTMDYFGYLLRDPDPIGYQNWVATLTSNPNDYRHMIFGFIYSTEYRQRFGTP